MNRKTKVAKLALKDALVDLMKEKPLASISVRSLCEQADINRSTFYAHYEDLNSLVREVEQEFISRMIRFDGCIPQEQAKQELLSAIQYVKENRDLFLLLLKNGMLRPVLLNLSRNTGYEKQSLDQYHVLVAYSVSGSFSALEYWLTHPTDQSESDIADMLYRACCSLALLQMQKN